MAAGSLQPVEVEQIGVDIEATAVGIGLAQPAVAGDRQDYGLGAVIRPLAQRLEGIGVDAEEAALVERLAIGAAVEKVLRAAEMKAAHIGLVGRAPKLKAAAPILVDVPGAGAEDMAA